LLDLLRQKRRDVWGDGSPRVEAFGGGGGEGGVVHEDRRPRAGVEAAVVDAVADGGQNEQEAEETEGEDDDRRCRLGSQVSFRCLGRMGKGGD